jgi:hypothetical protein
VASDTRMDYRRGVEAVHCRGDKAELRPLSGNCQWFAVNAW